MENHTQNVSHNHSANHNPDVNKAKGAQKGGANKSLDVDGVLNAALNQQVGSLYLLADVQTSESKLSVAMRQHAVKNCTDRVEMLRMLLELQGKLCASGSFDPFSRFGAGVLNSGNLESTLEEYCNIPTSTFAGLDKMSPEIQKEFFSDVLGWKGQCHNKLTAFQGLNADITPQLNLATSNEESAKALSDNEQNGVGALGQSMTQLIAQLSAETNMFSDVIAG